MPKEKTKFSPSKRIVAKPQLFQAKLTPRALLISSNFLPSKVEPKPDNSKTTLPLTCTDLTCTKKGAPRKAEKEFPLALTATNTSLPHLDPSEKNKSPPVQ